MWTPSVVIYTTRTPSFFLFMTHRVQCQQNMVTYTKKKCTKHCDSIRREPSPYSCSKYTECKVSKSMIKDKKCTKRCDSIRTISISCSEYTECKVSKCGKRYQRWIPSVAIRYDASPPPPTHTHPNAESRPSARVWRSQGTPRRLSCIGCVSPRGYAVCTTHSTALKPPPATSTVCTAYIPSSSCTAYIPSSSSPERGPAASRRYLERNCFPSRFLLYNREVM